MSDLKFEVPTATKDDGPGWKDSTVYEHPAFGTIVLTNPQGGDGRLFGSDLKHGSCLRIEINRATLRRDLSHDWIHGSGSHGMVCSIEMSHHQFAEFITSQGKGGGTPCTIRYAAADNTPLEQKPHILPIESKAETMKREVQQMAAKGVADIREQINRLGQMVESGKISIKELRDVHKYLLWRVQNLPSSMEFVVNSAQETIEQATTAAKLDIEGYVSATVTRLGLESLQDLAKLAYDKKDLSPGAKNDPVGIGMGGPTEGP
jgi:hypothetical protein